MNKKLLTLMMAGGVTIGAFHMPATMANEGMDDKKEHAQEKMDEFIDAVDATDTQKEQIRAIHDKYEAQLMAMKKDMHQQQKDLMLYIFSPEATQAEALRRQEELAKNRQKMAELMMQASFEKKALLTPEQQEEAHEFFVDKFEDKMDK